MVLGVINLTAMVFKVYEVTINIIPNLQYGWNCFIIPMWEFKITTMKNRGATPRCFNRVPEGKKDA